MKKTLSTLTALLITATGFAQWTTNGENVTTDKNIGIGTTTPTVKLDVNGDIKANVLHLQTAEFINGVRYSYIDYPGHSLVIGSPKGAWAHNHLEVKPGGATQATLFSTLQLFKTPSIGTYERMVLINTGGITYFNGGNVGIGTDNPQHKLDVLGTIRATEVKVESAWADFVFDKDYKLPTLQEIEAHINEHKRLPDIPSEKQVKEDGINIGDMQAKLLQKIEELTFYMINQDKEIRELKTQLKDLK